MSSSCLSLPNETINYIYAIAIFISTNGKNILNSIFAHPSYELDKDTINTIVQTEHEKSIISLSSEIEINLASKLKRILNEFIKILLDDISVYPSDKIDRDTFCEIIKLSLRKQNNKYEEELLEEYENQVTLENIYEAVEDGNYAYE
jgi:hypothetical protein